MDSMSSEVYQKLLLKGLMNTVLIAVSGLIIGIIIGTLIAAIKVYPKYTLLPKILDKLGTIYVGIFRGTPIAVQLLVTYYVLLPMMGLRIPAFYVGVIVYGMNSGAYVAEIMRSGFNSVDGGQLEAGRSLGLSYGVSMMKIVVPQAIKNILPTLGNEFITLIKETSVLSFITVVDLYTALMTRIGGENYEFVIPSLVLAAIYIILVSLITLLIKLIERIMSKSDRRRGNVKKKSKGANA